LPVSLPQQVSLEEVVRSLSGTGVSSRSLQPVSLEHAYLEVMHEMVSRQGGDIHPLSWPRMPDLLPQSERIHLPLAVRQEDDLPEHSTFPQHLMRAPRFIERQASGDQRLDLALFEQVQQR
jgi:hypothetical protein